MAGYTQLVIDRSKNLMVVLGYVMALAAFFIAYAQYGEITPTIRILQWALLAVPIVYVAASASMAIRQRASD